VLVIQWVYFGRLIFLSILVRKLVAYVLRRWRHLSLVPVDPTGNVPSVAPPTTPTGTAGCQTRTHRFVLVIQWNRFLEPWISESEDTIGISVGGAAYFGKWRAGKRRPRRQRLQGSLSTNWKKGHR